MNTLCLQKCGKQTQSLENYLYFILSLDNEAQKLVLRSLTEETCISQLENILKGFSDRLILNNSNKINLGYAFCGLGWGSVASLNPASNERSRRLGRGHVGSIYLSKTQFPNLAMELSMPKWPFFKGKEAKFPSCLIEVFDCKPNDSSERYIILFNKKNTCAKFIMQNGRYYFSFSLHDSEDVRPINILEIYSSKEDDQIFLKNIEIF
jgi:hypothetical protein